MSHHSLSSLAWLQRAAAVASSPYGGGRAERTAAAMPAQPLAAAASVTPVQQLSAVVQTAVSADPSTAPQTTPADPSTPVTGSAEADITVQRFAQALLVALHRMGRGRDDDDGEEHHHRGHHEGHGRGHGHEHEGLRAYRSMDSLAHRLGDLAARLRQGTEPTGASATNPATTAPGATASPAAPASSPSAPAPEVENSAAAGTPTASTPPAATAAAATAAAAAPKRDPLQWLLDAFSALTTAPAASTGATTTPATSPRERLASFLDQLATLLATPARHAANEAQVVCGTGRMLNLAA